jgi:hypothetical protein
VVLDWVTSAGVVFSGRHVTTAGQPTRAGPCFLFLRHLQQVPTVASFVWGLSCCFLVIIGHYLQGLFHEVTRASLRPLSIICLFTTYITYTSFCPIWFFLRIFLLMGGGSLNFWWLFAKVLPFGAGSASDDRDDFYGHGEPVQKVK